MFKYFRQDLICLKNVYSYNIISPCSHDEKIPDCNSFSPGKTKPKTKAKRIGVG